MRRVVWAEAARQEWRAQYRFYIARNPDAARRMREAVMAAARRLAEYPMMGRPGRVPGSRELVISGTPFVLVYDVTPDLVAIVHLYHGRQDWAAPDETPAGDDPADPTAPEAV